MKNGDSRDPGKRNALTEGRARHEVGRGGNGGLFAARRKTKSCCNDIVGEAVTVKRGSETRGYTVVAKENRLRT